MIADSGFNPYSTVVITRRELLEKAKTFYVAFLAQDAGSEELRYEMALAHLRLHNFKTGTWTAVAFPEPVYSVFPGGTP